MLQGNLFAADALSHAPVSEKSETEFQEKVEAYVDHITIPSIPATPQRPELYRQAQIQDIELESIANRNGQPEIL